MGKLVLFLADGSTLDIRLDRERITIGRRADNDVCLPYPAVSGEHAAVVTILADSFLEDLGSTNGTLVNGKPIAKHFLRDRDQIDIGRQRLVYVADESVRLDPADQALGRLEHQIFGERVAPALAVPTIDVPLSGIGDERPEAPDRVQHPVTAVESANPRGLSRRNAGERFGPAPVAAQSAGGMSDIDRFIAAEVGSRVPVTGPNAAPSMPDTPEAGPVEPRVPKVPAIRVLSGPNAGREVALDKAETSVGRVGVQVAAIRRFADGYRLVPVEGASPPGVNGTPVAPEGQALKVGDVLEIAGVRLEVVGPPLEDVKAIE